MGHVKALVDAEGVPMNVRSEERGSEVETLQSSLENDEAPSLDIFGAFKGENLDATLSMPSWNRAARLSLESPEVLNRWTVASPLEPRFEILTSFQLLGQWRSKYSCETIPPEHLNEAPSCHFGVSLAARCSGSSPKTRYAICVHITIDDPSNLLGLVSGADSLGVRVWDAPLARRHISSDTLSDTLLSLPPKWRHRESAYPIRVHLIKWQIFMASDNE